MDVVEREPVAWRGVLGLLEGAGQAYGQDCGNEREAVGDVFDQSQARGLIVGAAEADVGDRDVRVEVLVGEMGTEFAPVVDGNGDGLCGLEVTERSKAGVFGGGAAVVIALLKSGAEEF